MATRLDTFRDHCSEMAQAEHKLECPMLTWREPYWPMWSVQGDEQGVPSSMTWNGPKPTTVPFEKPVCTGCNPERDRELFKRLATEVAAYQDLAMF